MNNGDEPKNRSDHCKTKNKTAKIMGNYRVKGKSGFIYIR